MGDLTEESESGTDHKAVEDDSYYSRLYFPFGAVEPTYQHSCEQINSCDVSVEGI